MAVLHRPFIFFSVERNDGISFTKTLYICQMILHKSSKKQPNYFCKLMQLNYNRKTLLRGRRDGNPQFIVTTVLPILPAHIRNYLRRTKSDWGIVWKARNDCRRGYRCHRDRGRWWQITLICLLLCKARSQVAWQAKYHWRTFGGKSIGCGCGRFNQYRWKQPESRRKSARCQCPCKGMVAIFFFIRFPYRWSKLPKAGVNFTHLEQLRPFAGTGGKVQFHSIEWGCHFVAMEKDPSGWQPN